METKTQRSFGHQDRNVHGASLPLPCGVVQAPKMLHILAAAPETFLRHLDHWTTRFGAGFASWCRWSKRLEILGGTSTEPETVAQGTSRVWRRPQGGPRIRVRFKFRGTERIAVQKCGPGLFQVHMQIDPFPEGNRK